MDDREITERLEKLTNMANTVVLSLNRTVAQLTVLFNSIEEMKRVQNTKQLFFNFGGKDVQNTRK